MSEFKNPVILISMSETVTATEAARHLPDLLQRVHDRGESFTIVRNDEEVAWLTAPPRKKSLTLNEFFELMKDLRTGDPTFADDLEKIQAEQPPLGADPWDS